MGLEGDLESQNAEADSQEPRDDEEGTHNSHFQDDVEDDLSMFDSLTGDVTETTIVEEVDKEWFTQYLSSAYAHGSEVAPSLDHRGFR